MSLLSSFLILLAPLGAGLLLTLVATNKSVKETDASLLGYGLLVGMLLATAILRGFGAANLALTSSAFLLAAFLLLLATGAVYKLRSAQHASYSKQETSANTSLLSQSLYARFVFLLMLALIAAHIAVPALEASYRPLYPWDAAMHWATKSKVWFETRSLVPFVSNSDWLLLPSDRISYTDHHANYPPTMPLLQVWVCLAVGAWNSSAISAPWMMFLVALSLVFYGQAVNLGVSRLCAICFTYLMVSLPMIGTHTALAGYADFPLGVVVLAALALLVEAEQKSSQGRLVLAIVLAVWATQIKNEGFFWALSLLPCALFLYCQIKVATALTVAAGLLALLMFFLIPTDLVIAGHSLESLKISFNGEALAAVFTQFTETDSWHLMPVLLLGAFILCANYVVRDKTLMAFLAALVAALILYLLLFSVTKFSFGALRKTASLRIFLHLTPALMFFAMLVYQQVSDSLSKR
ncbi:MAG: hypothetical protein AAF098_00980 [Pseudomonadota bacterium]